MSSSYPLEDPIPWTTARCNRLLRPIASRLAILRKNLQTTKPQIVENHDSQQNALFKPAPAAERRVNISQGSKDTRPRGFDKAQDPDWIPAVRPKCSTKRMYRGRPVKVPAPAKPIPDTRFLGQPGEICLPTPFISRSFGKLQDSPQLQNTPSKFAARKGRRPLHTKLKDHLQNLKMEMTPETWKQVDGLYGGFSNLLQTTKAPAEKTRKGTRSLMSSCLRQVPAYIALEEYWQTQDDFEDDDDRDISAEVYEDLESLGACEGQGWRQLREVVRAHAVCLLRDAIEDEVLGPGTIQGLYQLCMNVSAWNEAEEFLASYVSVQKPMAPPPNLCSDLFDAETSPCLSMLYKFIGRTWRYHFLYDQLELMLSQELLPVEWLATQGMLPIWSRIVRTLSDSDHRTYANAFKLLETAVLRGIGCQIPLYSFVIEGFPGEGVQDLYSLKRNPPVAKLDTRDALSNTFSSLLTILASIALVSNTRAEEVDRATMHSVTWALDAVALNIATKEDIGLELLNYPQTPEAIQTYSERALWSLVAAFLVHLGGCNLGSELVSVGLNERILIIDQIGSTSSQHASYGSIAIETLPKLVCSTARCAGRAWQDDGFDQLQRLVQFLISPPKSASPHSHWFMKRLALDSSLEFAEESKAADHSAFAREIEKTVQSFGPIKPMKSPTRPTASPAKGSGFRWEEGICEWVACTPYARQQVKRAARKPMPLALPPTPIDSGTGSEPGPPSPAQSAKNAAYTHSLDFPESPESPGTLKALSFYGLVASPESSPSKPPISNIPLGRAKAVVKLSLNSQSHPILKRRRTSSIRSSGSDSREDLAKAKNIFQCGTTQPKLSLTRTALDKQRRSLAEITNIVAKLKSGVAESHESSPEKNPGKESRDARMFQMIDSEDEASDKNTCIEQISIAGSAFHDERFHIDSSARRIHRKTKASEKAELGADESDGDELCMTNVRKRKYKGEARRVMASRSLKRTLSSASAPSRRRPAMMRIMEDSDDELSFG